jgi:hypothetical protein
MPCNQNWRVVWANDIKDICCDSPQSTKTLLWSKTEFLCQSFLTPSIRTHVSYSGCTRAPTCQKTQGCAIRCEGWAIASIPGVWRKRIPWSQQESSYGCQQVVRVPRRYMAAIRPNCVIMICRVFVDDVNLLSKIYTLCSQYATIVRCLVWLISWIIYFMSLFLQYVSIYVVSHEDVICPFFVWGVTAEWQFTQMIDY